MAKIPVTSVVVAAPVTPGRVKPVGKELNSTKAVDAVSQALTEIAADVHRFVFAGKARFTIVSQKTSARVSYYVKRAKPKNGSKVAPFFVSVTDDRTADDRYLGCIWPDTGRFNAPREGLDAGMVRHREAFVWFLQMLEEKMTAQRARYAADQDIIVVTHPDGRIEREEHPTVTIASTVQFWHRGYCCACGLVLDDPLSIHSGWGPVCAKNRGIKRVLPVKAEAIASPALAVAMDAVADRASSAKVVAEVPSFRVMPYEEGTAPRVGTLDSLRAARQLSMSDDPVMAALGEEALQRAVAAGFDLKELDKAPSRPAPIGKRARKPAAGPKGPPNNGV